MSFPIMIPVESSNISKIGYDAEDKEIYLKFNNNSIYVYKNVEQDVFEELKNARSIGSYINRNFKNVYTYERLA